MVLVNANVLLDMLTADVEWGEWSETQLQREVETEVLAINPIIYAELAPAYRTASELERALKGWTLERLVLPTRVPGWQRGGASPGYWHRGADGHVRGSSPRQRRDAADLAVRAPQLVGRLALPTTWGCTGNAVPSSYPIPRRPGNR